MSEEDIEDLDPDAILDEIIESLTSNQSLLESEQEISQDIFRKIIADLNFSFIEILKRIREKNSDGNNEIERVKKRTDGMYA